MNQPQHNKTRGEKPRYFEEITAAIIEKQGLSFVYEREDGEIITHNAVYPRHLFRKGNQFYFRAYCHFPGDTRVFRLDRVKSLQFKPKQEPLIRKQQIVGVVVVVLEHRKHRDASRIILESNQPLFLNPHPQSFIVPKSHTAKEPLASLRDSPIAVIFLDALFLAMVILHI